MKSVIVANWKMNPASFKDAKKLFEATKKAATSTKAISLIVAPPSLYLHELAAAYRGSKLQFAAQNARSESAEAHTGEISMVQIKDAGAKAVLVGHAERRALGETNDDTRQKVADALRLKLMPIFCVGERERGQNGEHFNFVKEQLRVGLADVAPAAISRVLVAYEPVWAIGAPQPMTPRDMHEMGIFIRKSVVEQHGDKGHAIKILYGGAVDAENAAEMLVDGDVSGLLIGRASTNAKEFTALLSVVQKA